MSAVLVSLAELKAFLALTGTADDVLLQAILDSIEQLFLEQAGRRHRPFANAQTARAEVRRGTGCSTLELDYPVAGLTGAITIGRNPAAPDETLDPTDQATIAFAVGSRLVERTDGGHFGDEGVAAAVRVTYDAQADLPESPKLAIKRVAAAVYRQRGAEDVKSERTAGYSRELADVASGDSIWRLALDAQRGSGLA